MGRRLRILSRPGVMVEVVQRAFQGRYLIRPGKELNPLLIGALAKAAAEHGVEIYGGACLSGHLHLLTHAPTVKALADFMRDFTRKLSIECGRLHRWQGRVFPNRYHCTEVADEPEAQLARLAYCLGNGSKENLVASPLDWPGVPFAEAMLSGEPLRGMWIDRTAYGRARDRGQDVTLADFTEHLELRLAPLPCLKPMNPEERRSVILGLIRRIEEETAARHRAEGTSPIGVEAVLSADPHDGPTSFVPSPQPWFHTSSRTTWHLLKEALLFIVMAYREAADRLKSGELGPEFPGNTFPPALPFVEPRGAVEESRAAARLQPG